MLNSSKNLSKILVGKESFPVYIFTVFNVIFEVSRIICKTHYGIYVEWKLKSRVAQKFPKSEMVSVAFPGVKMNYDLIIALVE